MNIDSGTYFDYEKFTNALENIKNRCIELKKMSEKHFESIDYISGPAKEQIDLSMNRSVQMAKEFIPHLDELVSNLEKVLENYLQSQEDMKNSIQYYE